MKNEIKDVFIELGYLGVSPIKVYNLIKDLIFITKEDLNLIKNCFLVRVDGDMKYVFSEGIRKPFYIVGNESELEIMEIRKMTVWEKLVNSLDSCGDESSF